MAAQHKSVAGHVLFALMGLGLIALGVRLFIFQQSCQAEKAAQALAQQQRTVILPARRGTIFANSHSMRVALASSRQVPSCFADPSIIRDEEFQPISDALAPVLGMKPQDIFARLTANRHDKFVWLARRLDDKVAQKVVQTMQEMRLPGRNEVPCVGIQSEWRRYYPNGSLAAHVVGFAGAPSAGEDAKGLEGMELNCDEILRAIDGKRVLLVDAGRRAYGSQPEEYIAPQDGNHVQLTIDAVIQGFLEEALEARVEFCRAESGVGVVMNPQTGEILALANVPTYDLNNFSKADMESRRNRAITDPYEPGSAFKPFIAVQALAKGAVRMGEVIDCHQGAYNCRSGRLLHDADDHGLLSFEGVLIHSSNIGMAIIGERLGNDRLYEFVNNFGFGRKTGLELKGEDPGLVNPLKRWTSYTTTSVPMGQEVGVTAIQLATAFSAIGNDGLLLKPRLIQAVYDANDKMIEDRSAVQAVRQIVPPQLCRMFREQTLGKVPVEGTGRTGRLDGWTSFGKTGTAQISRKGGRGYEPDAYTATYVAGAPVGKPRLVCLISVRKPDRAVLHYGGTVSGPVVKEVLEKSLAYLDVPMDDLLPDGTPVSKTKKAAVKPAPGARPAAHDDDGARE